MAGLFARLKLTRAGREMIGGREYRHVSPVFALNEDNVPTQLLSVAATNTPAIDVPENTILNTEPTTTQDEVDNMTKEELKEFIINVMDERSKAQTALNEKCDNEKCDNEKEEDGKTSCSECSEGEKKVSKTDEEEDVKNEEPEEKEEVSKTDEEEKEDDKPEEKEDEKEDEKDVSKTDEEEVIKEEALNQKSTTTIPTSTPEWKSLKGEDFFKWCREHPAEVDAACRGE